MEGGDLREQKSHWESQIGFLHSQVEALKGCHGPINQSRMGQYTWNCHAPAAGGSVAILKQKIQPPPLAQIGIGFMKR